MNLENSDKKCSRCNLILKFAAEFEAGLCNYCRPREVEPIIEDGDKCPECEKNTLRYTAKTDYCDNCHYFQGYP